MLLCSDRSCEYEYRDMMKYGHRMLRLGIVSVQSWGEMRVLSSSGACPDHEQVRLCYWDSFSLVRLSLMRFAQSTTHPTHQGKIDDWQRAVNGQEVSVSCMGEERGGSLGKSSNENRA
jgi:hypothetical protein